jgi:hypothetical protein
MPGVSEPGDRFGAAVPGGNGDCVWIGVPGESVGDVAAAGDVIRTHIAFNTARLKPFGYTISGSVVEVRTTCLARCRREHTSEAHCPRSRSATRGWSSREARAWSCPPRPWASAA